MSNRKGELNPNWRDGRTLTHWPVYMRYDWQLKSRGIRNRDNNTCQTCGQFGSIKGNRLGVNHKDGDFWNWSDENLETLCEECHREADRKRRLLNEIYLLVTGKPYNISEIES